jgi:signal recognition particle GTPase
MLCPWLKEHKSSLMRKKQERFKRKLLKNEFGFDDFLSQIQQVKNG